MSELLLIIIAAELLGGLWGLRELWKKAAMIDLRLMDVRHRFQRLESRIGDVNLKMYDVIDGTRDSEAHLRSIKYNLERDAEVSKTA